MRRRTDGHKYARAGAAAGVSVLHLSRGLGMAMLPVRLGSVPGIAVIELRTRRVAAKGIPSPAYAGERVGVRGLSDLKSPI